MLCSSTSVEGWGGVELTLAGPTPTLSTRDILSVDLTPMRLAANIQLLTVLLYTSLVMVYYIITVNEWSETT